MNQSQTSYSFYILFIILGVLFIAALGLSFESKNSKEYATITVSKGDTIWSLAEKYDGIYRLSKQDFIQWVEEKNYLYSSNIFPGDQLIIPVKKRDIKKISNFANSDEYQHLE